MYVEETIRKIVCDSGRVLEISNKDDDLYIVTAYSNEYDLSTVYIVKHCEWDDEDEGFNVIGGMYPRAIYGGSDIYDVQRIPKPTAEKPELFSINNQIFVLMISNLRVEGYYEEKMIINFQIDADKKLLYYNEVDGGEGVIEFRKVAGLYKHK